MEQAALGEMENRPVGKEKKQRKEKNRGKERIPEWRWRGSSF